MQLKSLQRKIKAENVPSPHVFTKAQKLPSRNILTISPRTHAPTYQFVMVTTPTTQT